MKAEAPSEQPQRRDPRDPREPRDGRDPAPREVRLQELISAQLVRDRIVEIAAAIAAAYQDRPLVLLVIAEGARRFGTALLESLEQRLVFPDLMFVRARRTQGTTLGAIQVDPIDLRTLTGRDVLIVDDIADEGLTLDAIAGLVHEAEPASLELAVLVSKTGRRRVELDLRYVGFQIERGWVVGFGMDLDGHYRELDAISAIEGSE